MIFVQNLRNIHYSLEEKKIREYQSTNFVYRNVNVKNLIFQKSGILNKIRIKIYDLISTMSIYFN